MTPKPISDAYYINPISLYVCMCIAVIVAGQRLSNHVPAVLKNCRRLIGGSVCRQLSSFSRKGKACLDDLLETCILFDFWVRGADFYKTRVKF